MQNQRTVRKHESRGPATAAAVAAGILTLLLTLVLAGLLGGTVAAAGPAYVAVDVPSRLGPVDYTPEQLVLDSADVYSLEAELPAGTFVGAVHRLADGTWIFAPRHPVTLDQQDYEPRDLIRWDGAGFSPELLGKDVGIPAGARIDAVMLDGGAWVLSFDIPVELGQVDRGRSDLLRWGGNGWELYWDAAAAEVPPSANLVGAELTEAGELLLAFEEPVDLGQTTYTNGQVLIWDVTDFALYDDNPAWPPSARLMDFALAPLAGEIPATGGGALRISKTEDPFTVKLDWGASCDGGDGDYVVYEGTIADEFEDHEPVLCSTGGATDAVVKPQEGPRYFLVAPRNALTEGTYGTDSAGASRPAAGQACLPRAAGGCS